MANEDREMQFPEITPEQWAERDAAVERMGANDGMQLVEQTAEEREAVQRYRDEWHKADAARKAQQAEERQAREAENHRAHAKRMRAQRKLQGLPEEPETEEEARAWGLLVKT